MKWTPFPVALAAVVLLAACGDDDKAASDASQATVAATTSQAAAPTTSTLPPPSKIVSLSPTATEMLFAIGAGDQVLAIDDQSNYPPEALEKPHDLSSFEPNVEAVAALKPDLVVIADDFTGITTQLEAARAHRVERPGCDHIRRRLRPDRTARCDHRPCGVRRLRWCLKMQTDIDAAVKAAPQPATPLTYYHELDNTYYSVTENTFIGQVYSLFGLQSIADFQEVDSDYPQLSAEAIISADPDFIFLADGESPEPSRRDPVGRRSRL